MASPSPSPAPAAPVVAPPASGAGASRPSFLVRWLTGVSGLLVLGQCLLLLFIWPSLPAEVPTRFGFSGHPTHYGPSLTLLMLPLASLVILAIMVMLPRRPELIRLPGERGLSAVDRARHQPLAVRWSAVLLTFAITVLTYLTWEVVRVAQGNATGLGAGFAPVVVLGFAALVGLWFWRARRLTTSAGSAAH